MTLLRVPPMKHIIKPHSQQSGMEDACEIEDLGMVETIPRTRTGALA